jgi:hypothetical protein
MVGDPEMQARERLVALPSGCALQRRRYHDDVLIDQLAEALTDVWRGVALPLDGCVIDAAE